MDGVESCVETPDVGPSVLEIERWEMVRWKMEKVEDGTGGGPT